MKAKKDWHHVSHSFFSCQANILHRLPWHSGILFSEESESQSYTEDPSYFFQKMLVNDAGSNIEKYS